MSLLLPIKRLDRSVGAKSFRTLYICSAFDLDRCGAGVSQPKAVIVSNAGVSFFIAIIILSDIF